jgi:hypothetical protein
MLHQKTDNCHMSINASDRHDVRAAGFPPAGIDGWFASRPASQALFA